MKQNQRIALLIDCDNASANSITGVLGELAKYGAINVRHAFGNWESEFLSGWKEKLLPHSIRPMQQFPYTKKKNASDIALIIDAMDLLYSNSIDAFAIMSSDGDFTPLAVRIRERGFSVYGFGESKTPKPFVDACSTFFLTEKLIADEEKIATSKTSSTKSKVAGAVKSKPPAQMDAKYLRKSTMLVTLLTQAAEQAVGDDGWSSMAVVGSYMANFSSVSPKNYGYSTLGKLVAATELFDVDMRDDGTSMYIRPKNSS